MRTLFLIVALLFTFALGWHFFFRMQESRKEVRSREEMKKLMTATLQIFHGKNVPSEVMFWREVGRTEAMRDPWGENYRLEVKEYHGKWLVRWRSSGRDRIGGTSDDLELSVPFEEGLRVDFTSPHLEPNAESRVIEAK